MVVSMRIGLLIVMVLLSIWITYELYKGYLEERLVQNLWKGLLAEAASDGYDGMYAVACVVRNRLVCGMNDGLEGLKRKDLNEFVKKQPKYVQLKAKLIVRQVFEYKYQDTTCGAMHFVNVHNCSPDWIKWMKYCRTIGSHTFMKERTE